MRCGHHEDLDGGDHALAVRAGHEALADDALQDRCERDADLVLLVRREHADDAVDRLDSVERVQGRHHEVARLGRVQRGVDGLLVTHLAHEDDIRILPEGGAQGLREAVRVEPDLALVDHRAPILVQELDRILDGENVSRTGAIDVIDHRRERRRLARAGDPGHEDEATLLFAKPLHRRWQVELLEAGHLGRNDAEHHAGGAALLEDVHPIAHAVGCAVREVALVVLVEVVALLLVHEIEREGADHLGGERGRVAQRAQVALDAKHRREPSLEVHVRGAELTGCAEDVIQDLVHGTSVPELTTSVEERARTSRLS